MILSAAAEVVDFLQNRIRGHWPEAVVVEWIKALESVEYDIGSEAAHQLANEWTSEFPPPWGKMAEHIRAAYRRSNERREESVRGKELGTPTYLTLPEYLDILHVRICKQRIAVDVGEMLNWQKNARKQRARHTGALKVADSAVGTEACAAWFAERDMLDTDLRELYGLEA